MGSRENIEQGRGSTARGLCPEKRVKKSASKGSKRAAAVSRGATRSRARTSLKDTRKGTKASAAQVLKKQKKRNAQTRLQKLPRKRRDRRPLPRKVAPKTAPKTVAKAAVKRRPSPRPRVNRLPPSPCAVVAPRVEEPKKVLTQRQGFKTNQFVVYPAHGVGQILAIEEQEIAGAKLELFVINFMKDKMTLRVPTAEVANVGVPSYSEQAWGKRALEALKGRARVKPTMWSRRAQEYEAKVNSGGIVLSPKWCAISIALGLAAEQSPQRTPSIKPPSIGCRVKSVVQHVTETEAVKEIEGQLAKSRAAAPRPRPKSRPTVMRAGADGDDAPPLRMKRRKATSLN